MFLFLLLAIGYWLLATPIHAASEFTSSITATYVVNSAGVTTVTQEISLTNRLSNIYASQYSLTIGSTQVNNVSAFTSQGNLPTTVTPTANSTVIATTFPENTRVVGKDQTLNFTITYQNLDIANKNGRVLEVNIPKLANVDEVDAYAVTLLVPVSFDQPTLISPSPASQQTTAHYRLLHFTKSELGRRSISALFGSYQNFAFNLRYHLANPTISPTFTQIALPPDTAYQRLIYTDITPPPVTVTVDADGNWLAGYQLKAKANLEIIASGTALLYLQPQIPVPVATASQLAPYLKPQPFWPTTDPAIKDLAQKLATPENIYNYVVTNLTYNYDRIEANLDRLGAAAALANPLNAICTEFTDLFVALARAAGIPARAVNGFAYTNNPQLRPLSLRKDILHAWPEYFDASKNVWIPVDPTWGNTTQGIDYFSRLDLNHFAFAILGQDSNYPYPAGSYKLADTQGKDVNISFGTETPAENPRLNLDFRLDSLWPTSLVTATVKGQLIISNTGNVAVHQPQISLESHDLQSVNFTSPATINITIPPYGTWSVPLEFTSRRWWTNQPVILTAIVNDATTDFTLKLTPLRFFPIKPVLELAGGFALAGMALLTGRLLLKLRDRINPS